VGIFDFLKKHDPRYNHPLEEEERLMGTQSTKMKAELKRMQHEHNMAEQKLRHETEMLRLQTELADLQDQLADFDEEEAPQGQTPEMMLMAFLMQHMNKGQQAQNITVQPSMGEPPRQDGEPTDEELRQLYRSLPDQYKKMAMSRIKK
jgi:hypothetical protein